MYMQNGFDILELLVNQRIRLIHRHFKFTQRQRNRVILSGKSRFRLSGMNMTPMMRARGFVGEVDNRIMV